VESTNDSPEPKAEPSPEALLKALTQDSPGTETEVSPEDLLNSMMSDQATTRSGPQDSLNGPILSGIPQTKPVGKTPMGAMMLCLVVYPGAGHISCGYRNRGIFWMVFFTFLTLVVLFLGGYNIYQYYHMATSLLDFGSLGMVSWGPFFAATAVTVLTWGAILVDTYLCASKQSA
jgi:hypothetical protein